MSKNLQQSEVMSRAAARGAQARQRAHEGVVGQINQGNQQGMQMGQAGAQAWAQGEETQRRQDALDLEAAKSGFTRDPQQQAQGGDRQAQLEAEMQAGAAQGPIGPGALPGEQADRMAAQARRPMQQEGSGPWRMSEQEAARRQSATDRANYRAITERMEVMRRIDAASQKAQQASFAGDWDAARENAKVAVSPAIHAQNRLNSLTKKLANGEEINKKELKELVKSYPGATEGLKEAIEAGDASRIVPFMNAMVAKDFVESVIKTKGLSEYEARDDIDWNSTMMRQYVATKGEVADLIKNNPVALANAEAAVAAAVRNGDNPVRAKNRYIATLAATRMWQGMGTTPQQEDVAMSTEKPDAGGIAPQPYAARGTSHAYTPPGVQDAKLQAIQEARSQGLQGNEALEAANAGTMGEGGSLVPKRPKPPSYASMRAAGL